MARYIGPVCRLCRREGTKLFLKGERCFKPSCAIEKRNFPPGQHGQGRKAKIVGYALRTVMSVSCRILGGKQDHLLLVTGAHCLKEVMHGSEEFDVDQGQIHRDFTVQQQ